MLDWSVYKFFKRFALTLYATPFLRFLTVIIKQANQKAKTNNAKGRIEPRSAKTWNYKATSLSTMLWLLLMVLLHMLKGDIWKWSLLLFYKMTLRQHLCSWQVPHNVNISTIFVLFLLQKSYMYS